MPYLWYEVDTPLSTRYCTRDHSPTRCLVKLPLAGLPLTRHLIKLPSTAAAHCPRCLLLSLVTVSKQSTRVLGARSLDQSALV